MLLNLFVRLWQDETAAVMSTEYLMLGSIVAAGGTTGMIQLRDSMTDEYKEFGQSVRELRQSYTPPIPGANRTRASQERTPDYSVVGLPPSEQVGQSAYPTFSMP